MNETKESNQEKRSTELELSIMLSRMNGNLKFLSEVDCGTITRNDCVADLLKQVESSRILLKEMVQKNH